MRRQRIAPIIILIIGIPLSMLVLFLLAGTLFSNDSDVPNDSALLPSTVTVVDDNNAYIEMQELQQITTFDSEPDTELTEAISNPSWNGAYANEIIANHSEEIALFRQAATKSNFQQSAFADPATLDLGELTVPIYTGWWQTAQVAALEAEKRARDGDVAGGLAEALDIVRLTHSIENSQEPLISYLIASNMKQTGLTALRQIALTQSITTSQAKETAQALEAFRDSSSGQIAALKLEYLAYKNYLQQEDRVGTLLGSLKGTVDLEGNIITENSWLGNFLDYTGLAKYYYHPHETLQHKIDYIEYALHNAEANCAAVVINPPRISPIWDPNMTVIFQPNAVGNYLISIGETSLSGLPTKRCDESLAVSATQAVFGIQAYIYENGSPPGAISELTPGYLKTLPTDPYNGRPLNYIPEREIVYSVGPGREDMGGSEITEDWQNQDNPSFSITGW